MQFCAGAVAMLAASVGLLFLWGQAAGQENCGNGVPRWQCGGFLQDTLLPLLPYAFFVAALSAATLFAIGLIRIARSLRGRIE